eukprot:SAG11_NODE_2502_length_3279_cov_1.547627_4_plen_76_part_00
MRESRFSLPFFLHYNPDFLIETLPTCVDVATVDAAPLPPPILAHDFLLQRLREIGLFGDKAEPQPSAQRSTNPRL